MRAIRQYEFGDPDVLRYEEVDDPTPGPGQVRIRVEAVGVHLIDTRIRQGTAFGSLPVPELPMTPGREVGGVVDMVGERTDRPWIGRRVVAQLGAASGGYASMAVTNIENVFALADGVGMPEAVAMIGTGRTALGILEVAQVQADDVVLVTAAAGGIGSLVVQAAHNAGATVVGAVGDAHKLAVVTELGADAVVNYGVDGWPDRVRDALDGRSVTLGLDGIGGDIGRAAFELVGAGGRMVLYGFASGAPMALSVGDLFITGVAVSAGIGARVMNRPGGLRPLSEAALTELADGRMVPLVHPVFALGDAADAHRALETRATTGKVVLVP